MAKQTSNCVFLRRKDKVIVTPSKTTSTSSAPSAGAKPLVDAIKAELLQIGYKISQPLETAMLTQASAELGELYKEIIVTLREKLGVHRKFIPLTTLASSTPAAPAKAAQIIGEVTLGTKKEFMEIFTTILESPTNVSKTDKDDVVWYISTFHQEAINYLPKVIPNKELSALVLATAAVKTEVLNLALPTLLRTANDVLRFLASYKQPTTTVSGAKVKFKSVPRSTRRIILKQMEAVKNLKEEMKQNREEWKRAGEILHPNEFTEIAPKTCMAFKSIRENATIKSWDSKLEAAFIANDWESALKLLKKKPGVFARKLDQLLSIKAVSAPTVLRAFSEVGAKVSTPLLIQLWEHFANRNNNKLSRTIRSAKKGQLKILPPKAPLKSTKPEHVCDSVEEALKTKLKAGTPLGKVFIGDGLDGLTIATNQRDASEAKMSIPIGSRIKIGNDPIVRFFIWWKEGETRTDIDLSAAVLGESFNYQSDLSYYSLKQGYGRHSGDITSAPNGACEFIELNLTKLSKAERYILMSIYSFTGQQFKNIPECFAGWEMDKALGTAKFSAKSAAQKFTVKSDATSTLPMIIDTHTREVIWLDKPFRLERYCSSASTEQAGLQQVCQAAVERKRMSLIDLVKANVSARGTITSTPDTADIIVGNLPAGYEIKEKQVVISQYDLSTLSKYFLQ